MIHPVSLIESFSSLSDLAHLAGAATAFLAPASAPAEQISSPSIIPTIIHEAWKNGCRIVGPKDATISVNHYHGCLGDSVREKEWFKYVRAIPETGAPPVALILPKAHKIVRTTPQRQQEQLSNLMKVLGNFTDEQKTFLPTNMITNSVVAALGGIYKTRMEGAQMWHDLVFSTETKINGTTGEKIEKTTVNLEATAPLMLKAGEEVTGVVAEARRSWGIDNFISSGWSMGLAMAAYEAFYGKEVPLGFMASGAALLREVCAARPIVRNNVHGVIVVDENDPITPVALRHNAEDIEAIKREQGLTNLYIDNIKGDGHFMNCDRMARNLAILLNMNMRHWAPDFYLTPS